MLRRGNIFHLLNSSLYFQGAGDAGLGLLVSEDVAKRQISIKDVLPTINIKSIRPATAGTVQAGDVLVAIRQEDVVKMPLTRGERYRISDILCIG